MACYIFSVERYQQGFSSRFDSLYYCGSHLLNQIYLLDKTSLVVLPLLSPSAFALAVCSYDGKTDAMACQFAADGGFAAPPTRLWDSWVARISCALQQRPPAV